MLIILNELNHSQQNILVAFNNLYVKFYGYHRNTEQRKIHNTAENNYNKKILKKNKNIPRN